MHEQASIRPTLTQSTAGRSVRRVSTRDNDITLEGECQGARESGMHRFGEKLRHLRMRQRLTLQELAAALGYSAHGYLSELESGKKQPSAGLVLNVARLFGVTTDQLLRDELEVESDES